MAIGWRGASVASCALSAAAVFGQSTAQPEAASPAGELAVQLVRNDIPAGIVAPRRELVMGLAAERGPITASGKATFSESLAGRIELFNASGGPFRARSERGVVHLRSADEPAEVTKALSGQVRIDSSVTVNVIGFLRGKVAHAMRGNPLTEGYVYAGPPPGAGCSMHSQIRPPQGSNTAEDLLDELVRQVPGLAWVVTYEPDRLSQTLMVGIVCRDGSNVLVNLYN